MGGMEQNMIMRKPHPDDGMRVWQLVRDSKQLDVNSPYCYIMLCDYFRDYCLLAEQDGAGIGFVSSFRKPDDERTLFIWQIVVAEEHRGKGLSLTMLRRLLDQLPHVQPTWLELTISPSNQASHRMFHKLADQLGAVVYEESGYPEDWFPGGEHESETLCRIGPLRGQKKWMQDRRNKEEIV